MIELLIRCLIAFCCLFVCLIGYLLYVEICKQKQPKRSTRRRAPNASNQMTPQTQQLSYVGIGIGTFFATLFRAYGFDNPVIWSLLIVSTVVLILMTLAEMKQTTGTVETADPGRSPQPHQADTEIQRQLIRMCAGDRDLAKRLVDFERWREGKPESWYWQAAIDRLVRDRR